jgi:Na+/proline symporter
MLPESPLRVPKGHEMLAILAFVGIWCGIVSVMFQSIVQALLRRMRSATGRARLYAAALVLAAMLPIALAGAAQAYVYLEVPDLPWVSLAWRARGVPVFISFAFWEWITCLVLSAYMVALAVTTARLKAA